MPVLTIEEKQRGLAWCKKLKSDIFRKSSDSRKPLSRKQAFIEAQAKKLN